ncbi:unnamed protein product [Mytilus coruscus]|uniref:LRP4 n=1 Tax=Mytilus coruscus TaxID=42192 RepID=A0A6J8EV42_MYTCO|nr:unnamed protein product [Mytilus coruscus]
MPIHFYDSCRFAYPSNNRTLQTVVQLLSSPSGIAVDSINDHLYWVDPGQNKLSRCNLDGSNVTVLLTLSNPWVIRLDITYRLMYIVELDVRILKSRFSLSEQQMIVDIRSPLVECMNIDIENRLYWINGDGDMKSSKDDGSDVKTILSTSLKTNYYAISISGSDIYYSIAKQLFMINKTSGSTPTVLYNDTNWIYSILVFKSSGMLITITYTVNLRHNLT